MIKIACSGFPVGRPLYQSKLKVVEIRETLDRFPRPATFEKWRESAPPDFEFVVTASRIITHPDSDHLKKRTAPGQAKGNFQDSSYIRLATSQTLQAAHLLKAKLVVFQLPHHLSPHPDPIGRLQSYMKSLHRGPLHFVWEPPAFWPLSLVNSLSKSLHLVPALNPLAVRSLPEAPMRYFRLGDLKRTRGIHAYTNSELRDVKAACDKPLSYVIFNNGPTAFQDAVRMASL